MKLSFNEVKYIHIKYGKNREEIEKKLLEPYSQFEERLILWLESGMETAEKTPKECFGREYDSDDPECQVKCPIRVECEDATNIFRIKNKQEKRVVEEIKTDIIDFGETKIEEIEKVGREDIIEELKKSVPIKMVGKGFKVDTYPILNVSKWDEKKITVYSTKGVLPYARRWKNLKIKEYKGVKVKIEGMEPEDLLQFVKDMLFNPLEDMKKKPETKTKKE